MNTNITTDRLTLRPFTLEDAPRVRKLAGDYEVARMCGTVPHPYPEGVAEEWIAKHEGWRAQGVAYPFAIEVGGELMGSIGVGKERFGEHELGYWLGQAFWGHGFATEAVRAALTFAFDELEMAYVRARHISDNRASARVLGKVGFLATERIRKLHAVRGTEIELTLMVLPGNAFLRDGGPWEKVYKAA